MSLAGKSILISGGSRGIGLAIALRAARDGANVAIAAKTLEPHPRLPGTIFTAAAEIEAAGGQALPIACDIREEDQVQAAVAAAVERFGGIDILINNASAIAVTPTPMTDMKRYDLMNAVNTRGTFLLTKTCAPHLKRSADAQVLNIAPPLDLDARWFAPHVAYTIAKMGMSLCTLGHSREFEPDGISVNSLWPLTAIDTAAVRNILGGDGMAKASRTPEIMGDAAYHILSGALGRNTGRFFIDEEVLREVGITDFSGYAPNAEGPLVLDFFVSDQIVARSPTELVSAYR